MDIDDYSGFVAVIVIPLVVFIAGAATGVGWERRNRRALYAGLTGVAAVGVLTFIATIAVSTSDDEAVLSTAEEVFAAALNAGLALLVGGIGAGAGYGLSYLQRSRQIGGARLALIIAAAVLTPLIISGACIGCVYLFSDASLEPPPAATPER